MKKYITILLVSLFMLAGASSVSAQSRFGIIGGMTFTSIEDLNWSSRTGWHAGLTYKIDLPLGFSIQPSLMYQTKGASFGQGGNVRMDYLELPLSIQWGPDLLLFRPFLDFSPYIGYAVNNQLNIAGYSASSKDWFGINRFEYGIGLGVGLELWRFQVIGRYNWNFGSLSSAKDDFGSGLGNFIQQQFNDTNFEGFSLTVALLFGGGGKK